MSSYNKATGNCFVKEEALLRLTQTFYFEGFPVNASPHDTVLLLKMLRDKPISEGKFYVNGHYITPGSLVFQMPPSSKKVAP